MTGIIGRKRGITQVFRADGTVVPVTVIEAAPGCVVQVKNNERDGYEAVQIGFLQEQKEKRINKPMTGVFKSAGQKPSLT